MLSYFNNNNDQFFVIINNPVLFLSSCNDSRGECIHFLKLLLSVGNVQDSNNYIELL